MLTSLLSKGHSNLESIQLTDKPENCDVLIITGVLSRTQLKSLLNFWKLVPPTCKIISLGDCGSNNQDLFSLNNKDLVNKAIHVEDLAEIVPIDHLVKGCPPEENDLIEILTR